ncbi:MAG: pimeloyl-ACP methyl ester esterase BioH [Gammaproteobacteria bacterium]|nr:pimeloyl-ACP methyl ester esterase BioH [Gammaproteobacteria bacterium]
MTSHAIFIKQQGTGTAAPLVFLHGWGFHGGVWDGVVSGLVSDYQIFQVDLPGHGRSGMPEQESLSLHWLADRLADQLPEQAVWIGWSLGGLVAQAIADRHPASVKALFLAASSPRFVRGPGWPHAMTPEALHQFALQLRINYAATIQRFLALQVKGCESAHAQLREIRGILKQCANPRVQALEQGLALLAETDLRDAAARLACPVCLCVGERDRIVPAAMAADWQKIQPRSRTICIQGAGHMPFLSHPARFLTCLREFFHEF